MRTCYRIEEYVASRGEEQGFWRVLFFDERTVHTQDLGIARKKCARLTKAGHTVRLVRVTEEILQDEPRNRLPSGPEGQALVEG